MPQQKTRPAARKNLCHPITLWQVGPRKPHSPTKHGPLEHDGQSCEPHIPHICKPVAKGLDIVVDVRLEDVADLTATSLQEVPVSEVIGQQPFGHLPLHEDNLACQRGADAVEGRRVVAGRYSWGVCTEGTAMAQRRGPFQVITWALSQAQTSTTSLSNTG